MRSSKEAIAKLSERLNNACSPQKERRSENHWTAHTWQVFFEDINFRAILDSSGNEDHDRPDVQVWVNDDSPHGSELWVEAKPPGTFQLKNGIEKVLRETTKKLESCLRNNETVPDEILITDFHTHYVWPSGRFLTIIENFEKPKRLISRLGKPISLLKTEQPNQFRIELKKCLDRWETLSSYKTVTSSKLDIDSLISSLLGSSTEFRKKYLDSAVSRISKNTAVKKLFKEWMEAGGELAVNIVSPEVKKVNVGAEEAFAELCFHTVMVRAFTIKWFLDHGYLAGTDCSKSWGLCSKKSKTLLLRRTLSPVGEDPAEQLISDVFGSTDVYLWILDAAPMDLWSQIKFAFDRYTLVAEKSDVLGEFYQRYMKLYAKEAQLLLGQFYTPHTLTRAMWKLAGDVLRKRGLSLHDSSCLVIDPAVGTGTFLTQGLRLLLDGAWGSTKRQYTSKELGAIAKRFTGFEVNPLSRGVAVVNCLTELLSHSSDGCRNFKEKIRVFETNAYDVPDKKQLELIPKRRKIGGNDKDFISWKRDVVEATAAKGKDQYRVVIANPPWRNPSPACRDDRTINLLRDEIMPWAWEYKDQKLSDIKGCIHGIRDDYAFFMGLSVRLLQERGLLVFVTNESWLTAPTYSLLRKYLLDHFRVHAVVRVGPYFDGVKERAAILVAEKTEEGLSTRDQEINYLDWSDLTNNNWSNSWINERLDQLIKGRISRNEWDKIRAVGPDCRLRVTTETAYSNDLPSCVGLEDLFVEVKSGAQSGCGPIFLNTDKDTLERRVKLLFQEKHDELIDEIFSNIRGGRKKAVQLVKERYREIVKNDCSFDKNAIRPIFAHFPGNGSAKKRGFCYFDSRIWLFPRTDRVASDVETFWDCKSKIIFRDMYDPGDKEIIAAVEENGAVIDNHLFNGGVYVVSAKDHLGRSNLSEIGKKLREKFSSDTELLYYISAVLNSNQVQTWGHANPLERVRIPTDIEARIAKRLAKIEMERMPPWGKTKDTEVRQLRRLDKIATLFDKLIDELRETA